ncbi:hypothetical protein LWC34_29685 [Kibdelosporangium philippinense]|uniref:Uncharacterized protein n=1 Tax=Kibdelosporangium philippinense TaxID=211113 RepID=A0ABS8ZHW9_9PSEU|nr:hypothetical protein [Kibdelosporangium philippinense]MCE7006969.1 hypothetical protein [Kibdelosporangium philippinense]
MWAAAECQPILDHLADVNTLVRRITEVDESLRDNAKKSVLYNVKLAAFATADAEWTLIGTRTALSRCTAFTSTGTEGAVAMQVANHHATVALGDDALAVDVTGLNGGTTYRFNYVALVSWSVAAVSSGLLAVRVPFHSTTTLMLASALVFAMTTPAPATNFAPTSTVSLSGLRGMSASVLTADTSTRRRPARRDSKVVVSCSSRPMGARPVSSAASTRTVSPVSVGIERYSVMSSPG